MLGAFLVQYHKTLVAAVLENFTEAYHAVVNCTGSDVEEYPVKASNSKKKAQVFLRRTNFRAWCIACARKLVLWAWKVPQCVTCHIWFQEMFCELSKNHGTLFFFFKFCCTSFWHVYCERQWMLQQNQHAPLKSWQTELKVIMMNCLL